MLEPDEIIDQNRIENIRLESINKFGVIYHSRVINKISTCIVEKILKGSVGEGITYPQLVNDAAMPSWIAYQGLFGHVLALVSLQSYEADKLLLSVFANRTADVQPPSEGFCTFLQELGLVVSTSNREECLELWDYHWKKAVTHYESMS